MSDNPTSRETPLQELAKLSDAAAACNRCGFCTSFCPTYKATGNEIHSPRGRVQMARGIMEGKIADPLSAAESIDTCLLCGECTSVCFSEVPTATIMIAARNHLNRLGGVPPFLRFMLSRVLPYPGRMRMVLRVAFLGKRLGFAWLFRKTGLLGRIPALAAADEQMPAAPLRFMTEREPAKSRTESAILKARMKASKPGKDGKPSAPLGPLPTVAFFPACGEQYARPSTGLSTLRLLERLKIGVMIPDALCCGLPAASYGVLESVRAYARANIERLEKGKFEAIVIDDASCGAHMRDYPSYFDSDLVWEKRATDTVGKIRDINDFLLERGLKDVLSRAPWNGGPVAFHDPCKSQYGTKSTRPPRELLDAVPGLKLVPVADADQCCGGAGTFAVVHSEMSRQIVAAKAAHVRASGCKILVTSAASCLIQLAAGMRRTGSDAQVMHITEFLDRVLTSGR